MTDTAARKATPAELKNFFGTPDKPVTNGELMAFLKADKPGYTEVAELLGAHLAASGA